MEELFSQLGINPQLLAAQGVNFLLVLVILMTFVYRPLIKLLKERRATIEQGLQNAAEAEKMLASVEVERLAVLADAKKTGAKLVETAEAEADTRKQAMIAEAQKAALAEAVKMEQAAKIKIEHERAEAQAAVKKEAASLIVAGMEKLLKEELTPAKNEELIKKLVG